MQKSLALLAALCLLLSAAIVPARAEQQGFATPEAAIEAFVAAIAAGDAQAVYATLSAGVAAKHLSSEGHLELLFTAPPLPTKEPSDQESGLPPFYEALLAKGDHTRTILAFCGSFFADQLMGGSLSESDGSKGIAELGKIIDPAQFKGLKLVRVGVPTMMQSADSRAALAMYALAIGALERRICIALYDFNGQLYAGGVVLIKYDEGWFIETLNSADANTNSLGEVLSTDEAGFDALLAQ